MSARQPSAKIQETRRPDDADTGARHAVAAILVLRDDRDEGDHRLDVLHEQLAYGGDGQAGERE